MREPLTYPDLHITKIGKFSRICKKKIHKFGKRFAILLVFSLISLLPLSLFFQHDIKLLLTGLFGGRIIELVGEALVDLWEEM